VVGDLCMGKRHEPTDPSLIEMTPVSRPLPGHAGFHTTRWTRVCLAKADSEDGRRALADLCDAYYEPVVTFLRIELRDVDAARELTHCFFAQMLAGGTIHTADRERGRFRSYLLGAVKHYLSHQRQAVERVKRGGGMEAVSMDDEAVSAVPDARHVSPDAAFDRQWALTVLARALDALKAECVAEGRADFLEQVKPWLTGDAGHGDQAALAGECGMSPGALKMAVHRLKHRFRQCVKAEVAGTLDDPAMVEEEMRSLFAALA
jgi:DNA-directed RNA polymerase specialized sigma24 family protein